MTAAGVPHGASAPAAEAASGGTAAVPASVPAAAAVPDMAAYLAEIRRRLQANLRVPDDARRMRLGGTVVVRFRVLADGRLDGGSLIILQPAALESLDRAALEAVQRSAPFPPPAAGAAVFEVPVVFTIR